MKSVHMLIVAALAACTLAGTAAAASLDDGVKAFRAHDLDEAVRQLRPLADLGDPDAAWYLGTLFNDETDRKHRDDNAAYRLLARAARAGNPMAAAALYKMRARGKVSFMFEAYGLGQDKIDALAPLRKAAESGKADAISVEDLTRLAVAVCESQGRHTATGIVDTAQDNQPAWDWLLRAAQAGQPQAQFLVGLQYLGRQSCYVQHDVNPDPVEAQKWLRKAASQGIIGAQVMVARIDRQPPRGLTPDLAASLAGLRSAAARDDAPALAVLADYTANGLGQPADAAQAARLRQRASELGDPSATWVIVAGMSGKEASPEQLRRGFDMLGPCAESGDQRCQFELAMRYIQGRGTAADKPQFFKWMKMAANSGNSTAEAHLGQTLLFDSGPDRDVKAGIDYLREAASRGNPEALGRLADEYRTGEHIPQDLAKSWALYKLAAQRGDPESPSILEQMRPQLRPTQIDKGDQLAQAWSPDRRAPGAWDWRALAVSPRNSADSF